MPEGWPQRGAKRSKKTDGVGERWSGGVVEWWSGTIAGPS